MRSRKSRKDPGVLSPAGAPSPSRTTSGGLYTGPDGGLWPECYYCRGGSLANGPDGLCAGCRIGLGLLRVRAEAEASRLRAPPNEVEVRACPSCGAVSLARYGAGEPSPSPPPCLPSCPRLQGRGEPLLVLRYVRLWSAP